MSRSLPVALAFVASVLLVVLFLWSPGRAGAQTVSYDTVGYEGVTNYGDGSSDGTQDSNSILQGFTTGRHPFGYLLDELSFYADAAGGQMTVSIYEKHIWDQSTQYFTSAEMWTRCGEVAAPGRVTCSFGGTHYNRLKPNTYYVIKAAPPSDYNLLTVESDDYERSGWEHTPGRGWSIDGDLRHSFWIDHQPQFHSEESDHSLMMTVVAKVAPGDPPKVESAVADGRKITLTFDQVIDPYSVPSNEQFVAYPSSGSWSVSGSKITSVSIWEGCSFVSQCKKLILHRADSFSPTDEIMLSYSADRFDGVAYPQDEAALLRSFHRFYPVNPVFEELMVPAESFTVSVTNTTTAVDNSPVPASGGDTTPPNLAYIEVDETSENILMYFNEELSSFCCPDAQDLVSFYKDGDEREPSSFHSSVSGGVTQISIYFPDLLPEPPDSMKYHGRIKDDAGNEMRSFGPVDIEEGYLPGWPGHLQLAPHRNGWTLSYRYPISLRYGDTVERQWRKAGDSAWNTLPTLTLSAAAGDSLTEGEFTVTGQRWDSWDTEYEVRFRIAFTSDYESKTGLTGPWSPALTIGLSEAMTAPGIPKNENWGSAFSFNWEPSVVFPYVEPTYLVFDYVEPVKRYDIQTGTFWDFGSYGNERGGGRWWISDARSVNVPRVAKTYPAGSRERVRVRAYSDWSASPTLRSPWSPWSEFFKNPGNLNFSRVSWSESSGGIMADWEAVGATKYRYRLSKCTWTPSQDSGDDPPPSCPQSHSDPAIETVTDWTDTTDTSVTFNELFNGHEYQFDIQAGDDRGNWGDVYSQWATPTASRQSVTPTDYGPVLISGESLIPGATANTMDPSENSPATGQLTISGASGFPDASGRPPALVGDTLTVDTSTIEDEDGLDSVEFSYQWLGTATYGFDHMPDPTSFTPIAGATGAAHSLTADDLWKIIQVRVSFTDDAGNAEELTSDYTSPVLRGPDSETTGRPIIRGTVQAGETLTADTSTLADEDGLNNNPFRRYLWLVDDIPAHSSRGSDSTFLLLDSDVGSVIKVRVTVVDDLGYQLQLTSAGTAPVAAAGANSAATGVPVISGTVQVGETLTAGTSAIADSDGLAGAVFAYQWLADGVAISGATGSTYVLAVGDVGSVIKVRVSFTDNAGNAEQLTSEGTAPVAAEAPGANSVATGAPVISGTAQVGETLTADTSAIADSDGLARAVFAYQWLADDAAISGATGSTYVLSSSDEDSVIKVRVSFTDDAGNAEVLTSVGTDPVAGTAPVVPDPGPDGTWGEISDFDASPGHGNGLVLLSWTPPADADAAITHYDLRICEGSGCDPATGSWMRLSESKGDLYTEGVGGASVEKMHYYARGLTPTGQYSFQVRAVDATGAAGQSSNVDGARAYRGQVPPGVVTDLSAESGDGQVTLRWSEPSNEGRAISRYFYRYCRGAGCALASPFWRHVWAPATPSMSLTVSGLANGETYRFQVQTRNGSLSEYSDAVEATPGP